MRVVVRCPLFANKLLWEKDTTYRDLGLKLACAIWKQDFTSACTDQEF
jgi:hypothetical protein